MTVLWQAISDLRMVLRGDDAKAKRIAMANVVVATGQFWLQLEQGQPFGGSGDLDETEAISQACAAVEDLGGVVPMMAGGALLKIILPILVKLILEQLQKEQ
jgi:hypothetical protein